MIIQEWGGGAEDKWGGGEKSVNMVKADISYIFIWFVTRHTCRISIRRGRDIGKYVVIRLTDFYLFVI